MDFQEMILKLQNYWSRQNCVLAQPYDVEKGAGTMSPFTFLRALGPEPWAVAYVEPSRRPADGRYGDNPNRLYQHHQFQVIMKPAPAEIQNLYLDSLKLELNHWSMISALWKITGSRPHWEPGGWAGKFGLTAWKSPVYLFSASRRH